MPLFACEKCNTIENTALSAYWRRGDGPSLCSECDPSIARWHGVFAKQSATGYSLTSEGFIYGPHELAGQAQCFKNQGITIVRVIGEEK